MSTPLTQQANIENSPSAGSVAESGPRGNYHLRPGNLEWRDFAIYIGFVVVFALFALLLRDEGFLQLGNLLNIVRQTAIIVIMAVAGTFVIAAAQIDLSIGATAGLASVVTAMTISSSDSWILGALSGLAAGAVVGAINGSLVAMLRLPSFLVTLAMMGVAIGVAQWMSGFQPKPILDKTFTDIFGSSDVGPIPSLLIWAFAAVVVGIVVLNKTTFGRQVLATGGNEIAAVFSGVRTRRITFTILLVSGLVAGIAGMLYAGRLQSGRYQWGTGDELSVIAAVVLGGTSLFGGYGRVLGSVFGAIFIGLLNNGLVLAGFDISQQAIIQGVIIILAVMLAKTR
ncbi:ribose ABC transporter permease [Mycolicibacterium mageritense DSM 44476 = CIP 104973]|uniref:ABC transporter permease n=1 Tax=Mycolicibacterium mageritense TaxID=53462 RepID=A0ABM7HMM4_MYCME|nr:ABC transporter permease [Mycolicibacterium mageritense]MCC9180215.1 ABC transporter permease [Mycolicibacterium mageritense]OKH77837.1 ABC transporter permease [Mycobacterium sp. SWH-M3]BBX31763.1 ABC transporter permease [Mycolicibacterium mageritense]CDO23690.1 ribose transporter permease RbsC [Mycolicibacterium mageritense DSM 44476 = CIP 104973]